MAVGDYYWQDGELALAKSRNHNGSYEGDIFNTSGWWINKAAPLAKLDERLSKYLKARESILMADKFIKTAIQHLVNKELKDYCPF